VDETDLETHRKYFQTILTNTKEVQAQVQAQKTQTSLVVS
jgi:hypothetical protein